MTVPLVALAGLAAVGGVLNLPGVLTLEHFLEPALGEVVIPHGLTAWLLGAVALLLGAVGLLIARFFYVTDAGRDLRERLRPGSWLDRLVGGARDRFYVDELYGDLIVIPGKRLAMFSANRVDAGLIDRIVNGVGGLVAWTSDGLRRVQTGYVRSYALTFLFGVVVIVSLLVFRVGAV